VIRDLTGPENAAGGAGLRISTPLSTTGAPCGSRSLTWPADRFAGPPTVGHIRRP